ncbi:MAG: glycine zipper 2TM domain-containing protein [Burkholderiaceae bacterium]
MRNNNRFLTAGAAIVVAASLAACGTPMPPQEQYPTGTYPQTSSYPGGTVYPAGTPATPSNYIEYGRVNSIEVVGTTAQPNRVNPAGAIIGGVVGGVLGNQVGKGSGRDLATGVGVIGGAVAGNAIANRNNQQQVASSYRISIQVDNGQWRTYDVPNPGDLRVGDRVRIQNGQIFRA